MGNRKINVGLFTGYIKDPFSELVSRGAIRAAEELDVNLIIIPGNYLDLNRQSDVGFYYEYQPNTLFSFVDEGHIDVLLACVSSIGCLTTHERRRWLIDSIKNVPIITVASVEEGYSYVVYDNKSGLYDAIKYLIEEQNVRKLGMITGPMDNADFAERYQTFRMVLDDYKIPFMDKMVTYGDATAYATKEVEELLDNNPGIEAIIAANDSMALAVYDVCERRGLVIGRDIFVTGFDDVENSCKLSPPLASVRADANSLGYRALVMAIKMLQDKTVISEMIPTTFIPRESAGYQADDLRSIIRMLFHGKSTDSMREHATQTILNHVFYAQASDLRTERYYESIKKILDLYAQSAMEICNADDVRKQLHECFEKLIVSGFSELSDQHRIVQLYTIALEELAENEKGSVYSTTLSHSLTRQFKFLMDSMIHRASAQKRINSETMRKTNVVSRDMLMSESLGEQSYQTILMNMQMLDIDHSYLYLYETPQLHMFKDEWVRPEEILLKAYQDEDSIYPVHRTKQKMKSSEVFDNMFFNKTDRHTWVVLDLYSCEWQYGIFVCNLQQKDFELAELLTNQISPAVKMINLFLKEQSTQKKLEETLEQLTINNITLDRISRFDELTGILNRRGFMEEGSELLCSAIGKRVMVAYADLDSLKVINDLFGHDEGDYALRAATQILSMVFYQNGVIGRLGGDEFAAVVICDEEHNQKKIRAKLEQAINDFNTGVDKPYRVQISIGIDEIIYAKGMLLNDMLSQADDLLYQEKKNKKNILNSNEDMVLKEEEIEILLKQYMMREGLELKDKE